MPSFFLPLLAAGKESTSNKGYDFLNLGGVNFDIRVLLIGFTVGIMLACVISTLQRHGLARFFGLLRRAGADSPETAKSLKELSVSESRSLKKALSAPSSLYRKLLYVVLPSGEIIPPLSSLDDDPSNRRVSKRTRERDLMPLPFEEEKSDAFSLEGVTTAPHNTAFDPSTARYFMDEKHRRRAEVRYEESPNELVRLIIALLVSGVLLGVLLRYFPDILGMLDTLLGEVFGGEG